MKTVNTTDTIASLLKQLRCYYALFIIITITFAFISNIFGRIFINEEIAISLESLMILLNLAAIPLSLKYSARKINSICDECEDEESKISSYKKLSLHRLLLTGGMIIFNFILFTFLGKSSCMFCSGLIYMSTLFFFPTKNRIKSDLSLYSEEEA